MFRIVVTIATAVAAFVAGVFLTVPGAEPVAVVPGEVIVHEHTTGGFDVTPPTVLSVVMDPTGDPAQRCADMGGQLDGQVCRHVDY